MSIENAKVLVELCKNDKKLAESFKEAGEEGFEKAAAKAGYPCSKEDLTAALRADRELSDTNLETVSGGASMSCALGDFRPSPRCTRLSSGPAAY